jgi:SH3-like domain-containing protein
MTHIQRFLTGALGLLVLFVALPIQAQPILDWEAWLYDDVNARMYRIDSTATVNNEIILNLVMGEEISMHVGVSPSGSKVAYVGYLPNEVVLHVDDLLTGDAIINQTLMAEQPLNTLNSFDFNDMNFAWSDDESRIAVGLQINGFWTLCVYDANTGAILAEINTSDARISEGNFGVLPIIGNVTNDSVSFMLLLTGAGGAPEYGSYRWNTITQDIIPDDRFRTLFVDVLERTGEVLLPVSDYSLPNQSATFDGPAVQFNTLHVGLPNQTSTQAFVVDGNFSFLYPHFIQNGELIATFSDSMLNDLARWDVYDRGGVWLGSLQIGAFIPDMIGLSDGLLYSTQTSNLENTHPAFASANSNALVYINTSDGFFNDAGEVLYVGADGLNPRLVWARDYRSDVLPLPSLAWGRIGVSIGDYLAGTPLPPTPTPDVLNVPVATLPPVSTLPPVPVNPTPTANALAGIFQIGQMAEINTTNNDRANMRQEAGVGFAVLERLDNGTQVQIVGGPVDDGQFTWWQVRAPSGLQGWVVQSADGVQVLIPIAGAIAAPTTIAPTLPPVAGTGTLALGQTAFVTADGDNLNMRASANTNASVLAILPAGTTFTIIGGPVSNQGFVWWQINYNNTIGYVAEGSGGEMWIAPTASG